MSLIAACGWCGDDVNPSEDRFPGKNLTWLEASEVFGLQPPPAGGRRKVQAEFYHSHVGGRLVLPTIRVVREFLISDPQVRAAVTGVASPMVRTWWRKAFQSNDDQAESGTPL